MRQTIQAIAALSTVAVVSLALVLFFSNRLQPEPQIAPVERPAPVVQESSETVEPPQEDSEVYYVMIIGSDTRYGSYQGRDMQEEGSSYSDTMMLMQVDPTHHSIALCSIPRDTAVTIDDREGKMNEYHLEYGPEGVCAAISELFGVPISYYYEMTFMTFIQFIDGMGGVDVEVPMDMRVSDVAHGGGINLYAGEQHLNGPEALGFSRMRKQYPDVGEACRQQNARQLVTRVISRVAAEDPEYAGAYAELLAATSRTNMPIELLEAEVRNFMEYDGEVTFNTGTGPYWGDIDWTGMWRSPCDPEVYAQLSEAMQNGTPLTDVVPNPM